MDVAAVLGWLALAVVLNTSVMALLAVLAIRSGLGAWRADPGRRPRAGSRAPLSGGAPTGAAVAAPEGSDPLAGAIEAFLGRSDGLFRAGGPPPGHLAALGRPPGQAVGPGARSTGSMPATSSTAPAATAAPAVPSEPQPGPPILAAHDRPLSEVTWETSRPSRFVPSGPSAPSGSFVTVPPGRSVSRVSVALSGRDESGAGAGVEAVARLGPVIGGFIRERTRANDSVTGLTGGRYSVVLPDTSLDGAAALVQRLTQSCDAWLAAEEPPLRLEFGLADLPAYAVARGPATTRASGPERRRVVSPET
ncbi:MAG: hypothetical protein ACXWWR_05770 [Candidatus Limnocylindrales bacterium]